MDKRKLADWFSRRLVIGLIVAVGVVLLGVLLARIWEEADYSWFVLHYPHQIDYDEGINLHAAWLLSQGQPIYTPLDPNRFVSAPYPPLFYLLAAVPLRLAGLAFWGGRLISLLATVGIAVLIGLMAAWATRRWPFGVLSAAFFLVLGPTYVWASLYKGDMLAILCTLAGLAVVQRWADRRAVYWAVPLFVLAFFTKQTALIGPAVATLYLLVHSLRSTPGEILSWPAWRRPLLFALATAAAIAGPFFLLDLLLNHNLYLHVFTYQLLPWTFYFLRQQQRLLRIYPYLVGVGLFAAGYLAVRRRLLLYPLYLLVATGAVVLSGGYEGSNFNMLLDILPPLCLLVGVLLGELWEQRQHLAARAALLLVLALLLWQGLHLSPPTSWYRGLPSPEENAQMEHIRQYLTTVRDPILSEDVGILLLSGHPVEYDDPSTFTPLARAGVWDDRVLAEKLSSRYYNLVLLEYDITGLTQAIRWSPRVFQALQESYRLLYRDYLFIYEPRPRP